MSNQNIENVRNVISDYPKLWEWEAIFDSLPDPVKAILPSSNLTILVDTAQLPGMSLGDAVASYKGAKAHYGTRLKLDGDITINFKEVKGPDANSSWLVRKAMNAWIEMGDSFFGTPKYSVPQYKSTLKIDMQDETGESMYKVRYFGIRPQTLTKQPINYNVPAEGMDLPITSVLFTFDFWRDSWDPDFGPD